MQRNKGCTHRISSPLYGSFAKETYNFKEPTNRSRPIHSICREISDVHAEHADEYICFTDTQSIRMYMFVLLHRVCGCICLFYYIEYADVCLFYYTEYADVYVCFTTQSMRMYMFVLLHRVCGCICLFYYTEYAEKHAGFTDTQNMQMRMWCVAVCCIVLQCVAVCCSVLQCVAVRCSVLQCVAVCWECDAYGYSLYIDTQITRIICIICVSIHGLYHYTQPYGLYHYIQPYWYSLYIDTQIIPCVATQIMQPIYRHTDSTCHVYGYSLYIDTQITRIICIICVSIHGPINRYADYQYAMFTETQNIQMNTLV